MSTEEVTHIAGPVEEDDTGRLMLRIPLYAGGDEFIDCTREISEIDGVFLKIFLPPWLCTKFALKEGSRVAIDNAGRKVNLQVIEL